MDISKVWEELATKGGRIVYLILDGVAGLPTSPSGWTALQAARTFKLDELARTASCGRLELIGPGITPCCAAGQLALLGYDPLHFRLGRDVLSALGIDWPPPKEEQGGGAISATNDVEGQINDLNERQWQEIRDSMHLLSLKQRFGLRGLCISRYPICRGVSRLVGMDVAKSPDSLEDLFRSFGENYGDRYDFYFLHVREIDQAGENANFARKVRLIEQVDALISQLLHVQPDVLVVTADHSTPALMAVHSWHPVPVLIHSPYVCADEVERFDEHACTRGILGLRPAIHLMGLALANAGRLKEFGA